MAWMRTCGLRTRRVLVLTWDVLASPRGRDQEGPRTSLDRPRPPAAGGVGCQTYRLSPSILASDTTKTNYEKEVYDQDH